MKTIKWLIIAQTVIVVLFFGIMRATDSASQALLMLVIFISAVVAIGVILLLLGAGAWWSERLLTRGAQIAVDAGANTSSQTTQAIKLFQQLRKEAHGGPQEKLLPLPPSGLLPPSVTSVEPPIDDEFVIDGLESIK